MGANALFWHAGVPADRALTHKNNIKVFFDYIVWVTWVPISKKWGPTSMTMVAHNCNSHPKGSDAFFWSPWVPGTNVVHIHTCKQNINAIKKKKTFFSFKSRTTLVRCGGTCLPLISVMEDESLCSKLASLVYMMKSRPAWIESVSKTKQTNLHLLVVYRYFECEEWWELR